MLYTLFTRQQSSYKVVLTTPASTVNSIDIPWSCYFVESNPSSYSTGDERERLPTASGIQSIYLVPGTYRESTRYTRYLVPGIYVLNICANQQCWCFNKGDVNVCARQCIRTFMYPTTRRSACLEVILVDARGLGRHKKNVHDRTGQVIFASPFARQRQSARGSTTTTAVLPTRVLTSPSSYYPWWIFHFSTLDSRQGV